MKEMLKCTALAVLLLSTIASSGCLDGGTGGDDERTIVLYGFSVKGEVFDDSIIPAFKSYWKETRGEDVNFVTNYAGSGTITNQVITGAPAEIMILSTEWDALKLKDEGLVTTDWNGFPHQGTITRSPFIILTRNGNPLEVKDFRDLERSGVEVVHADPISSGGACWSVFAVYGSELRSSGSSENATSLLEGVVDNVISWQSSARKALSQFTLEIGDAMITYENDGLLAIKEGYDYALVYPRSTIFSEHKVVLVDRNIGSGEREMMEAFVDFLYTDEIQGSFVQNNFRSVNETLNSDYPVIEDPFTVSYLGGWKKAHEEIIDGIFKDIKG
ncbi:MAG: substrate-binding domain-containing protein [Thermoplasmatota archaeon]